MARPNCMLCAYRRKEKEFVQQGDCKINENPKFCNRFVSAEELRKYKEMMKK